MESSSTCLPVAAITSTGFAELRNRLARTMAWVLAGAKSSAALSSRVGCSERACAAAEISERMVTLGV